MAFVIGEVKSTRKKIKFDLPTDDGKPVKKADFVVELKVHSAEVVKERRKQLNDYLAAAGREVAKARKDPDHEADIPDVTFDEDYLREDVLDLAGILDADGNEISFSSELLEAVLNDRRARKALIDAWSELNLDEGAAKRKNS